MADWIEVTEERMREVVRDNKGEEHGAQQGWQYYTNCTRIAMARKELKTGKCYVKDWANKKRLIT